MSQASTLRNASPPTFLQMAGHRVRWWLLCELARSDRVVSELAALVGEPQNLVSYHLGKLRAGRLVRARRSAADGRDTYYGLDLVRVRALLSEAGGALHPGLRLAPPQQGEGRVSCRVLFLCTGNSARSQMAEALIRARSKGGVEARSAGSHPQPLHPNAVRAMREDFSLDLSDQVSKPLEQFAGERFDVVVTLCDKVREVCPEFPGQPDAIHWSLPNPVTDEDDAATYPLFQQTAAELETRIGFLLIQLAVRSTPSEHQGD